MGGAATESLAGSRKPSPRETEEGVREKGGRQEGVGMVAAGGAGLNINPRGRPGHAPLVRFHLNSRNHAAAVARLSANSARENRKTRVRAKNRRLTERRTKGDGSGRVDDHAVARVGRADERGRRRRRR